jgi:uncharacterized FlgJ-related protein
MWRRGQLQVGLAVSYGVLDDEQNTVDQGVLDELMLRVDVVPVSLALAQCAEESGWGTSRFAAEGNALSGRHLTTATDRKAGCHGATFPGLPG